MTATPDKKLLNSKTIFLLGLLLAASGIVTPPVALVGGIAFGFSVEHPLRRESATLARLLLQVSVIALGFGMNLSQVVHAGVSGFLYTSISITFAIVFGLLIGKLLSVSRKASFLITVGTAICGGSAIAAIAPISNATEEEISISMGTVFLLNSLALMIFPIVGSAMHLSQNQFGLWAALAIHDTSSVVGAAAKYGNQSLIVATTVKLARALWIVPVALLTAAYRRSSENSEGNHRRSSTGQVKMPWFILLFCLATVINSYLPRFAAEYAVLNHLGKAGLTATLFLIGTSLSKRTLHQVGLRPFVQGVTLWVIVATLSLVVIGHRWIAI